VGVFKGWGSTTVNNAGGGLWKTTDRGAHWSRINSMDRVTSCTFDPNNSNRIFMTTETSGLWYSDNLNDATPTFTQITSYPFRQPERVYFNPYNSDEVWVTSFGNGIRIGNEAGCIAPTVSISANGATTVCKPSTVSLTASVNGNVTYQWKKNNVNQSGATNSTFTASKSGNYSIVVTNACGSATSNSISVTVNTTPAASISPSGTITMCSGQSTLLTANTGANLNYQWKKGSANILGATNQTYSATTAANYKVIVTNALTGCSKTSAATKIQITCKELSAIIDQPSAVFPNPSSDKFSIDLGNEIYDLRVSDILGREISFYKNANGVFEFGEELNEGVYFLSLAHDSETVVRKIVKE
jgi:hypothetical protein